MTANEINRFKAEKEAEHWLRSDTEQARHNVKTEKQTDFINVGTVEHYNTQDLINKEHYERQDAINLQNAETNAYAAQTNRLNYEMAYDIEYNHPLNLYNIENLNGGGLETVFANYFGPGIPVSSITKQLDAWSTIQKIRNVQSETELNKEQLDTEGSKQFANLGTGLKGLSQGLHPILKPILGAILSD